MSFKVTYNGDIQYVKVFYSTEKTRAGKYYGEFYKKMDALASDLKRLKLEPVSYTHLTLPTKA